MHRQYLIRIIIIIGLSLFTGASSASAQLQSEGGWTWSVVRVPHPIHDVHIDACAIWLNLSPEQEHAVRRFRDQYEEQWHAAEMSDERRSEMQALIEAYDAEYAESSNYNLAELAAKMQVLEAQWIAAMRAHDERFFAEIEAILTDEQKRHMPRIRLWRMRMQEYAANIDLQEARLDLMELIRIETDRQRRPFSAREPQHITLSRAEYEQLLPAIDEYEPMFVAALESAARIRRQAVVGSRQRGDMLRSLTDQGLTPRSAPDAFEEIERQTRQRARMRVAPSRELERVNRWGLELFMQHLPDDKAAELQRIYLETAYPAVYPDPASAEKLYDAALALETTNDVQRDGLIALRDEYRRQHEALSQKIAQADRGQREAVLGRPEQYSSIRIEQFTALAEHGWERDRLNELQYQMISLIMNEDQLALLPDWDFESNPPGRPWWTYSERWARTAGGVRERLRDASHTETERYVLRMTQEQRDRLRRSLERRDIDQLSESQRARVLEFLEALDSIRD